MGDIPSWRIVGDWFDNCSCAVPCPCTFAQAPDNGFCESVLFWHVREGHYGDVKLDNLSYSQSRTPGRGQAAPNHIAGKSAASLCFRPCSLGSA
jgi:hypothetical protein